MSSEKCHHIVILGAGFGGLYAAKALRRANADITVVDRRNFHLFQPLLYQIATGGLSPGDIASPIRGVFRTNKNVNVIQAEVTDFDPANHKVKLLDGELTYDTLLLATGSDFSYFGHDEWESIAPGLKTVEDAIEIRHKIFLAFEAAERETDPIKRDAWMTFVIVGGGPTGVEMAGALGELAHGTLKGNFRNIDPRNARILLVEGSERLLSAYPESLSHSTVADLGELGVTVRTHARVVEITNESVRIQAGDNSDVVATRTVLWAAGVKASSLGAKLAAGTQAQTDRGGRVIVNTDFSVAGHSDVFVIGDLANYSHINNAPLPGTASVAMQEARFVADVIRARLSGSPPPEFHYRDKGDLAVIGRNKAVARIGKLKFSGFLAWLIWAFIHISYLIEFDNKILVLVQWSIAYFTRKRGSRLITGELHVHTSAASVTGAAPEESKAPPPKPAA
ncbi:NAD(P)/FAD-dependent oxidoreductase [soil metagenome]